MNYLKTIRIDASAACHSWARLVFTFILAVAAFGPRCNALAQQPRLPVSKLTADMVSIKRGPRLYGAIASRDQAGNVTLTVHRDWLQSTHQKYYEGVIARDEAFAKSHNASLLKRVTVWREERKDDVGMRVFLDNELARLKSLSDKSDGTKPVTTDEPTALMSVEILADEIKTAYAQPPERRRILLAAWNANIRNAVTRSPASLTRELGKLGVDWRNPTPANASQVVARDSEEQWAARKALVEFRLRKSLRFQGAGSFLAKMGGEAKDIPLEEVMGRVLKDQLTDQLNELLGRPKPKDDDKWLEQAIREAEKEGVLGFRVSRLEKDVARGTASVETSFYAKMPKGNWRTVFFSRATTSAADVKKESLEEVAAADDVKNIVDLLRGTGLPLGDDAIKRALGFGAATKEAMNKAQLQFVTFLNPFTKRVDSPIVSLH